MNRSESMTRTLPWLVALVIVSACAYESHDRILTVAPEPVPCAAGTPGTCIRVTDAQGDTWITRPGEIEGFTYEPGYTYRLQVEEASEAAEIEDATPPRLRLIQVVGKEGSGEPEEAVAASLGDGPWLMSAIAPSGESEQAWAASGITAEFDVLGERLSGFAGCNNYTAAISVNGDQIQVSAPASTRKACAPAVMALEQEFLERITGATSFVITDDHLDLSLADGSGMAFRAGPR